MDGMYRYHNILENSCISMKDIVVGFCIFKERCQKI